MFSARFLAPALFVLSSLTVPVASFADSSVDYSNAGGTLTGSNSGFSLSDSTTFSTVRVHHALPNRHGWLHRLPILFTSIFLLNLLVRNNKLSRTLD